MPNTNAYHVCGKTIGLSVANTSHAAVTIQADDPSANALLMCNTSTADMMYVTVASSQMGLGTVPTAAASVVPTDGAAGSIPVLSYGEKAIEGLRFPISITAISSIAGPTLLTATPICLL